MWDGSRTCAIGNIIKEKYDAYLVGLSDDVRFYFDW